MVDFGVWIRGRIISARLFIIDVVEDDGVAEMRCREMRDDDDDTVSAFAGPVVVSQFRIAN